MRSRTTSASVRLMKRHIPFQADSASKSTNSAKRSLDLDDSSDSEVEHSSFKRIRLVSWKSRVSQDDHFERDANKSEPDFYLEDQPPVEVKENASEEGYASDSDSMSSSLEPKYYEYEEFGGRRYNKYLSPYLQPIDELARANLDMLHHFYLIALNGKSFLSPIEASAKSMKIADLGCGTGIWVVESESTSNDLALHTMAYSA